MAGEKRCGQERENGRRRGGKVMGRGTSEEKRMERGRELKEEYGGIEEEEERGSKRRRTRECEGGDEEQGGKGERREKRRKGDKAERLRDTGWAERVGWGGGSIGAAV